MAFITVDLRFIIEILTLVAFFITALYGIKSANGVTKSNKIKISYFNFELYKEKIKEIEISDDYIFDFSKVPLLNDLYKPTLNSFTRTILSIDFKIRESNHFEDVIFKTEEGFTITHTDIIKNPDRFLYSTVKDYIYASLLYFTRINYIIIEVLKIHKNNILIPQHKKFLLETIKSKIDTYINHMEKFVSGDPNVALTYPKTIMIKNRKPKVVPAYDLTKHKELFIKLSAGYKQIIEYIEQN